jgi:hypothetical protein
MPEFIHVGPMISLFVVAFGLITLAAASFFAFRPAPRKLPFIKWMLLVTGLSAGSTLAASVSGVLNVAAAAKVDQVGWLLHGLAEALSPAILGLSLLTVAALVTAIGARRLALGEP